MVFKYIIGGFLSKVLASFDDAITRIPIIVQLTRTMQGRIAFSIGNFFAVTLAIIMAWALSSVLENFEHTRLITSIMIVALALAVYFDVFGKKKEDKIHKKKTEIKKHISSARFVRLVGSGFIISMVTLLDDFVVLTPLFLGSVKSQVYALVGIYTATVIQLVIMVYLANKLSRIKHVKEIAVCGLLVLAVVVYFGIF